MLLFNINEFRFLFFCILDTTRKCADFHNQHIVINFKPSSPVVAASLQDANRAAAWIVPLLPRCDREKHDAHHSAIFHQQPSSTVAALSCALTFLAG